MCGIAGFYNTHVGPDQIQNALVKLQHRGPDNQRVYIRDDVGLIHTRLSVIDLSDLGSQPYRFENLVLVFNGELYNYREVRDELIKKEYVFVSNSDTEVLIKAFHCWGPLCLDRFIGMFAFAIYDERADEMFLFRDRVGVKPLYYSYEDGALRFASELKVLPVLGISGEIDLEAVTLYFRFGFVPHHLSIFEKVSKLEAGQYIQVSRKGIAFRKYWSVQHEIIHDRKESEWMEELETLMTSAFRYRMVSDVPVGVFLSGGIDSSLLSAILQKHHGGIHSFTIGFKESGFDESAYAAKVADHLKTEHTQKTLDLEEARGLLANFYTVFDEPFADTSGIPTACVAHLARESGMKVVLSADGGDELFGGYTHYQRAEKLYHRFNSLPAGFRRLLSRGTRLLIPIPAREKIFSFNLEHRAYAFEELLEAEGPVEFFEAFLANQTWPEISKMMGRSHGGTMGFEQKGRAPLQTMMGWDFQYYLPDDLLVKVDMATMFHSVECREPFLDHRLVEFAARMPSELKIKDGKGKYLLRKLAAKYVPAEYIERRKQGFSIPIFAWFRKELDALFDLHLAEERIREVPFLEFREIEKEHSKYRQYKKEGKPYNVEKMWRILSFMLWWERNKTA